MGKEQCGACGTVNNHATERTSCVNLLRTSAIVLQDASSNPKSVSNQVVCEKDILNPLLARRTRCGCDGDRWTTVGVVAAAVDLT